ncbi:MAG: PQQ-binding-like beta-propeller repeat protein [Pirellulales bacterium]|nr:PQQ-binding-like beta-propeller repeat protein [Pirellulales bacterium]
MRRSLTRLTALCVWLAWCGGLQTAWGAEAPWPRFRGPGGGGIAAADAAPPTEVGPETNLKWKVEAPGGWSSPIVVGDLLVLTAYDGDALWTIAYRRADGSEAWRKEAPYDKLEPFLANEGSPAASTPATDGERIVSYFGSCGLFCYDLAGNELWRFSMPPARTPADFGTGVSPIIAAGLAVLVRDELNSPQIIALDVRTGRPKWDKARTSVSGYGTPAAWTTPAGTQIAAPGYGRMVGYDAATGAEAWFIEGMPASSCTSPVVSDGVLYFAGWSPGAADDAEGFKMPTYDQLLRQYDRNDDGVFAKAEAEGGMFAALFDSNDANKDGKIARDEWEHTLAFMSNSVCSAFAVVPGGEGDASQTHVLWREQSGGLPYVPSPLVYRGQLIMVKDGGIVTACDAATGKRIYQKRAVASGGYYASPVAAGDHVYFTSLADGAITVLKAGAPTPQVVTKNKPLGERTAATPAIVGETLFVRTAGHLWAFAEP